MPSYTYDAMITAERDDKITLDGVAWLAGWRAAEDHVIYVEAYGGDIDAPGDVPGMYEGDRAQPWHAGWTDRIANDEIYKAMDEMNGS